jgi:hypothetical protein
LPAPLLALEHRSGRGYRRFMVAPDSLPSAFRASDADREAAIRRLRDGSVDGRLSNDTFLRRVDRALRARGIDELAGLLRDLPAKGAQGAPVPGPRLASRIRAALRAPRLPRLVLPRGPRTVFTIGRSPDSDLPLGDITVSWHHAALRRIGDAWVLTDLESTNGTRVNGWRADSGITVRAGDRVSFGRAAFLLADGPRRHNFFLRNRI